MDGLRAFLLAGDAERRAIERELHDGVQQQLVGVAVNLQIARGLVESDPGRRPRVLDDMRAGVADTLDELRGLGPAHSSAAPRHPGTRRGTAHGGRSSADPDPGRGNRRGRRAPGGGDDGLPVCLATLAAAEGEGGHATVAVAARDGDLEFEVSLSGAHIAPASLDPSSGGVESLGGTLTVTPDHTVGRLPLTSYRRRPLPDRG